MKVLVFLALLGVILSEEVCNAQLCTSDYIADLEQVLSSCSAECEADLCTCCTAALAFGSYDYDYQCCEAYYGLLECGNYEGYEALSSCADLLDSNNGGGSPSSNGTSTAGVDSTTVACYTSSVMVLVSVIVSQIFL